jgi:GH24 family phage-related lysozyme (muramidase)
VNVILPEVVSLVSQWEQFRAEPYQDNGNQLAIGFGHSTSAGPPEVTPELRVTYDEAVEILRADLERFAKVLRRYMVRYAPGVELNHYNFGGCLSLTFNMGCGAFKNSRVMAFIRDGKFHEAAIAFTDYRKAKHKVTGEMVELRGLLRRRLHEADLFSTKETDLINPYRKV